MQAPVSVSAGVEPRQVLHPAPAVVDTHLGSREVVRVSTIGTYMDSKGRWYAAQTLPQTFSWTSEFLENICEKKLQECCTLFTLYEFKVLALINNLNTISKVLHADAAA